MVLGSTGFGGLRLIIPSACNLSHRPCGITAFASSMFDATRAGLLVASATDLISGNKKLNWTHTAAGLTLNSSQIALNLSRHAKSSGSVSGFTSR